MENSKALFSNKINNDANIKLNEKMNHSKWPKVAETLNEFFKSTASCLNTNKNLFAIKD